MPQTRWLAQVDGSYWLDVDLAGEEISALVDSGLNDQNQQIGFALEPALYDQLKSKGLLSQFFMDYRLDASGAIAQRENGLAQTQLIDPSSRQRVGPLIAIFVARGAPGVPNRVGIPFFHQLAGCRVLWDLDQRTWCMEYP